MKTVFELLKATIKAWRADKAPRLAAALSYYTLFSMAPVLVIAIAMVGLVFGEEAASGQVFTTLSDALGPDAAGMVQGLVVNARQSGAGPLAAGRAGAAGVGFGTTSATVLTGAGGVAATGRAGAGAGAAYCGAGAGAGGA